MTNHEGTQSLRRVGTEVGGPVANADDLRNKFGGAWNGEQGGKIDASTVGKDARSQFSF
jgi:hypothetical protein